LEAIPLITLLRTCVTTQVRIIAFGPNRSISLPSSGDAMVKTIIATDWTDERVALFHPKSSNIGLKNMLTATDPERKTIIQVAATIYQP
jgi:hypothetical protein